MERTNSSYIWQNSPASVRILHSGQPSSDPIDARLTSGSSARATLSCAKALPLGAAVSVHVDGGLVMAEVHDCIRQSGGGFLATVTVDKVVPSLSELGKLMDAIMLAGGPSSREGERRRSADQMRVPE